MDIRAQIEEGRLAAEGGDFVDADEVFGRMDLELAELERSGWNSGESSSE